MVNRDPKIYVNTILMRGKQVSDLCFIARTYSVTGLNEDSLISVERAKSWDPKVIYCNRMAIYSGPGVFIPILNTRVCIELSTGRTEYSRIVRRGVRLSTEYAQCYPDRTGKITVFSH